ncbi:MAG: (S)-ureidoglycine aminohydrolase [Acetobacteraceae bacterium]|nr:(S)-ureidoglycine aminohydrolase [Acetobacteraceae bacterium]
MEQGMIPPGVAGHNRSMVTPHFAVMPPDGILDSRLPGWSGARLFFQTSPQMGARFVQAMVAFEPGGRGEPARVDGISHFYYVVEHSCDIIIGTQRHTLTAGGYAYLPPGTAHRLESAFGARLTWIRKKFDDAGLGAPPVIVSHADQVAHRLRHTIGRSWQHLLPEEDLRYDFAVNILHFKPGTHFAMVETHIMEHGLLMLTGQGMYLLGRTWHEVWTGDFIWMGPYCPQQFYPTGWGDAAYLLYKDVNRDVDLG